MDLQSDQWPTVIWNLSPQEQIREPEPFRMQQRYAVMLQPMHGVSIVASVITGAVVGGILWWSYGRVRSGAMKALIAAGTAILGFVLFCLVQTGLEVLHPESQINGHIIAYDVNIFIALLVALELAIFFLRKPTNSSETQSGSPSDSGARP